MGLLNKSVFNAEVDFFGVKRWEQSDGDPPHLSATVRYHSDLSVAPNRSALALLIPLVAAKLLYNSKRERRLTTPMMNQLELAALVLSDPDEDPAAFSFRSGDFEEAAWNTALAAGDEDEAVLALAENGEHFEEMLVAMVPQLENEPAGPADCTFNATLMRGRAAWWSKVKAPWKGPAFFAMFGLFALVEHVARNGRNRATTLDPAMAGLRTLCHLHFEVLRGHGFDSMKTLTAFNASISDVVLAEDPREAFDEIRDMYEPLDVDPTPEVAEREAQAAAYRHEFNASFADRPSDDETGERIRQEAKRLRIGREVPDLTEAVLAWRDAAADDPLGDDPTEGDLIAAADAAENGYAVRMAEERLIPTKLPDHVARRMTDAPSNLTAAIEMLDSREDAERGIIAALFGHSSDAWEDLSFWSWQSAAHNSRERYRQMTGGETIMGIFPAAMIDYERAITFGYVLRAAESART